MMPKPYLPPHFECIDDPSMFAVVFNNEGRLISVDGVNGVTLSTTALSTSGSFLGASDFQFGIVTNSIGHNPYSAWTSQNFHAACVSTASYRLNFTSPQLISAVLVFNRQDTSTASIMNRPINSRYTVQGRAANGTIIDTATLYSATTVVVRNFAANPMLAPPAAPSVTDASLPIAGGENLARYLRITSAQAQFLHFRELQVFDASLVNVARGRSCATSGAPRAGTECGKATDGIIDFDSTTEGTGLFHHSSSAAGEWVEWDFGSPVDVKRIVLLNRWRSLWT